MSGAPVRQLAASFVIVVGVCVGGYEMFAAPANERLAAAEQRMAELRGSITDAERGAKAGPVLHQRADEARSSAEAIDQLGALAQDEAALFAAIEALAAERSVVVERISPARTRMTARQTGAGEDAPYRDRAVGIELSVRADFADLVACIERLQDGLGLCRIEAVSVTPDPNAKPGAVMASVRMTVFSIDTSVATAAPGEQQGGRS